MNKYVKNTIGKNKSESVADTLLQQQEMSNTLVLEDNRTSSKKLTQLAGFADSELNKKRRKVRVGLELAFNNEFTQKHFSNDGYKISETHNEEQIGAKTIEIANAWQQIAEDRANDLGLTLNVTNEAHPQGEDHIYGKAFSTNNTTYGRKKFSYSNLKMREEEFSLEGMSQEDIESWYDTEETPLLEPYYEDNGEWWWGITVDPAVFELQTLHTSWQVMNETQVANIIDGAIFGAAGALGLTADKGMGGGQINIDFTTGFDGNYNKVLTALNNAETNKEAMEESGLDESDDLNAPYIYKSRRVDFEDGDTDVDEEVMKEKWKALFNKYNNKLVNAEDWGNFTGEFLALLKKYPSKRQRYRNYLEQVEPFFGEDDHQEDIYHYQALNIGHLEHDSEAAKRVEFRDFRAQGNREQISNAIDLALNITPELDTE